MLSITENISNTFIEIAKIQTGVAGVKLALRDTAFKPPVWLSSIDKDTSFPFYCFLLWLAVLGLSYVEFLLTVSTVADKVVQKAASVSCCRIYS